MLKHSLNIAKIDFHFFWNAKPRFHAFHVITLPYSLELFSINALSKVQIANLGENIANETAIRGGWKTLERQKRRRGFELDIVIAKNDAAKILEVKTRLFPENPPDLSTTEHWLNFKKISALRRGAEFIYQKLNTPPFNVKYLSCDLIGIDFNSNDTLSIYRWPDAVEF